LSRNISKLEKIIILVVIVGAILAAGGFFIVKPSYEKIGVVDQKIAQRQADIERADDLIARAAEIEAVYDVKRQRAESVHVGFYEEMTTTEAVTMVQSILARAATATNILTAASVTPLDGITVTDIEEKRLSLQVYSGESDINYQLREYAFLFDSMMEGLDAPIEGEEAEFTPSSVTVTEENWDYFAELAVYLLTKYDASEIDAVIAGITSSRVLLMKEITEMLSEPGALSDENRDKFLDLMRVLLSAEDVGVGLITASFELEMNYAQYAAFLEYLLVLPELSSVNTAILWESPAAAGNELRGYSFELQLHVMMPMEIVEVSVNPLKATAPATTSDEQSTETDQTTEEILG